jgi:cell division transport system ATP-binding protein
MISLHSVHKLYPPDQIALRGLDVRVDEGEFVFVAGASGAGKSTLLKLLYGAERASSGEVMVAGRNMQVISEEGVTMLRREIGIVFQDYKLLPRKTVLENVAFGLEVRGVPVAQRNSLSAAMLEAVGLEHKQRSYPPTLSGGEQQRVAVARALVARPRLIIADEPTGNLDHVMTTVVFDLLIQAFRAGCTVVVASHNLAVIEELNFRTLVLDEGKLLGDFESPRGEG